MQGTRSRKASGAAAAGRPSARSRIFDTASKLFYARGIRAVGVETIAAKADTTKMSLYRSFPSKDALVAEWLRDHDAKFWADWDTLARDHPDAPGQQLEAAFAMLAAQLSDPAGRGCPMANAAVELTEKGHPARKVIEAHKAKLRRLLAGLCTRLGAQAPALLADQLFLMMEGAQVTRHTLGARGPSKNVAQAARALIALQLNASRRPRTGARRRVRTERGRKRARRGTIGASPQEPPPPRRFRNRRHVGHPAFGPRSTSPNAGRNDRRAAACRRHGEAMHCHETLEEAPP